jgi:hypothetical protein
VLDEWCEWRIGDKSPVQVPGIAQKLELIAMKTVAIIREQMNDHLDRCNSEQHGHVGPRMDFLPQALLCIERCHLASLPHCAVVNI